MCPKHTLYACTYHGWLKEGQGSLERCLRQAHHLKPLEKMLSKQSDQHLFRFLIQWLEVDKMARPEVTGIAQVARNVVPNQVVNFLNLTVGLERCRYSTNIEVKSLVHHINATRREPFPRFHLVYMIFSTSIFTAKEVGKRGVKR